MATFGLVHGSTAPTTARGVGAVASSFGTTPPRRADGRPAPMIVSSAQLVTNGVSKGDRWTGGPVVELDRGRSPFLSMPPWLPRSVTQYREGGVAGGIESDIAWLSICRND